MAIRSPPTGSEQDWIVLSPSTFCLELSANCWHFSSIFFFFLKNQSLFRCLWNEVLCVANLMRCFFCYKSHYGRGCTHSPFPSLAVSILNSIPMWFKRKIEFKFQNLKFIESNSTWYKKISYSHGLKVST